MKFFYGVLFFISFFFLCISQTTQINAYLELDDNESVNWSDVVTYYKFEDNINDSSDQNNDGVLTGDATYESFVYGKGVSKPTASGQIDAGSDVSPNLWTYCFWIKPTSTNSYRTIKKNDAASSSPHVRIADDGTLKVHQNGVQVVFTSIDTVDLGESGIGGV